MVQVGFFKVSKHWFKLATLRKINFGPDWLLYISKLWTRLAIRTLDQIDYFVNSFIKIGMPRVRLAIFFYIRTKKVEL